MQRCWEWFRRSHKPTETDMYILLPARGLRLKGYVWRIWMRSTRSFSPSSKSWRSTRQTLIQDTPPPEPEISAPVSEIKMCIRDRNVGASPDGRYAGTPLADGGMSPVYGRDIAGPTAVLKSVSRLDKLLTSNGGLLNMKFLPEFFKTQSGIDKFALFLRSFVELEIPHIQFNVVNREDLIAAKKNPEQYRSLTVRVAAVSYTHLAQ